jgi:hypothetical protein
LRRDPAELQRSLEESARATGDVRILELQPSDLDLERYELRMNREYTIDRTFSAGPAIVSTLLEMRWRLLRPVDSGHFFVTSDRPMFNIDGGASRALRHDLRSPGAMFSLPLTKEVLLLGDRSGPPSMGWAGITSDGVRLMNVWRAAPGLKIYSPEPDFLGHADLLALEKSHDARG